MIGQIIYPIMKTKIYKPKKEDLGRKEVEIDEPESG
jgi:hypothetical protein